MDKCPFTVLNAPKSTGCIICNLGKDSPEYSYVPGYNEALQYPSCYISATWVSLTTMKTTQKSTVHHANL